MGTSGHLTGRAGNGCCYYPGLSFKGEVLQGWGQCADETSNSSPPRNCSDRRAGAGCPADVSVVVPLLSATPWALDSEVWVAAARGTKT